MFHDYDYILWSMIYFYFSDLPLIRVLDDKRNQVVRSTTIDNILGKSSQLVVKPLTVYMNRIVFK